MDFSKYVNKQNLLIASVVGILTLFALWLRLLPMLVMGNTDILSMVGSDDPLYNLRQVEQILANFPNYAWYDPLVYYPNGTHIYWGSLFPTIIAVCCKLLGATTQAQIISVGLLVPCVMGALIVSVMYFVGRTCGDWKTGLLCSLFSAAVTGQIFFRSMYGYMDHHIAEVLFSTIFCLLYMYTLSTVNGSSINLKDLKSYKQLILLSALTGVAYLIGLYTMPTMILFAMIVVLFTVAMFIVNMMRGNNSEYLLVINTVVFLVAAAGTMLHGLNYTYLDLSIYSIWHVYSYLCVIAGTFALYLLAKHTLNKKGGWSYYFGLLSAIVVAGIVAMYFVSPQLYTLFVSSFFAFFGQATLSSTVQEARAWTSADAWGVFGFGLLLMLGGVIVAFYKNIKEHHPHTIFVLIWSVVMLFSTYQHVRYEYYLSINLAILAALCVSFVIDVSKNDVKRITNKITSEIEDEEPVEEEVKKKPIKKLRNKVEKKERKKKDNHYLLPAALGIVIIISGLFVVPSIISNYNGALSGAITMNPDWKESLEWMDGNTPPEVGTNFTQIYDPATYKAPEGTYGVMSWWDYGHMILTIGHRFPNANPFQQGINGEAGSSNYFMSINETEANGFLNAGRTRYVVTDIEMSVGKFWAMSTWYNSTASVDPYQFYIFAPSEDGSGSYTAVLLNKDKYYLTMVSRLHNFDGSLTVPEYAIFITYSDPTVTGEALPIMTYAEPNSFKNVTQAVELYNQKAVTGTHAMAVTNNVADPNTIVPALQHYRLVHESQTSTIKSDTKDLKYVKTFEYVEGAHIKGDGIIEVPIITNTGRTFTYRQASIDGEFIVPYSTTGNPYDVRTTGKYKIVGSNIEYDVSENSVMGV